MKNKVIILLFLFAFFSCKEKVEGPTGTKHEESVDQDNVTTISARTTNYDTLIDRVRNHGNLEAYDELFYDFKDCRIEERTDSVMVYSKIMAQKYNYERAYFDYFEALCEKYNIERDYEDFSRMDISKLDRPTKMQAEYWLNVMVEKKLITRKNFNDIKK